MFCAQGQAAEARDSFYKMIFYFIYGPRLPPNYNGKINKEQGEDVVTDTTKWMKNQMKNQFPFPDNVYLTADKKVLKIRTNEAFWFN